jgi:hypothetical protein
MAGRKLPSERAGTPAAADNIREKMATYEVGLPVNQPISAEGSYYSNFEAEFRNFWTNGS